MDPITIGSILLILLKQGPQIIESLKGVGTEDADKLIGEINEAQTIWQEWK